MDVVSILNRALQGRYHIEREAGAGGMATVYLAEDLKHHRQVAMKVLRQDVSASVGVERFLREIDIAAQLQHPNILPLLDSGEVEGLVYYVMPFVEGSTLGGRLQREGELPIPEAVRILIGIVDALAHAHEHDVVHRDVKPDNVMMSGRHPLVADFGVARAVRSASEGSDLTTMGVALGTPRYMAPEQAAADPHVDHRADLYSVGIVAYEMLTGQTPFRGATPQQLLAAQVTQAPTEVSELRPSVSPELEQIVMRCLEKRPANRWQSAGELLTQLEGLGTPSGGTEPTSARLPAVARPSRNRWYAPAAVVAVVALAGVAIQAGWLDGGPPPPPVIGQSTRLTFDDGLETDPALSPDGSLIAYSAGTASSMRVYIAPVGGGRTITLSDDTTVFEFQPRWSPDGTQILFLKLDGVYVASALGGVSRRIAGPGPAGPTFSSGGLRAYAVNTAAWSADGQSVFVARGGKMSIVSLEGGEEVVLGETEYEVHSCDWSPTGRWVACTSGNFEGRAPGATFGNVAPSTVILVDAENGEVRELTGRQTENHSPIWSPDGSQLFYLSDAQGPVDVYVMHIGRDGQVRGPVQRVTTGLGAKSISMSADGSQLAYADYTARANIWSLPIPTTSVDISGARQLTTGDQVIEAVRPSFDGQWLIYDSNSYGNSDIFRIPIDGGPPERLTSDPADEFAASMSPDGTQIVYHTWKTGTRDIAIKPLDGEERLLTDTDAQESYPAFSPDGSAVAFNDQRVVGGVPVGGYVARRDASGAWGEPVHFGPAAGPVHWMPEQSILYATPEGRIEILSPESGAITVVYERRPASDDPFPRGAASTGDASAVYFKSHDEDGRARIWSVPASGGRPTLLVRFDDPARPSIRNDLGVGAGRFFFTVEERRADIWVAEMGGR